MVWSREFDEPIALPDGRELVTLRDAAEYIMDLPRARIAVIKALNSGAQGKGSAAKAAKRGGLQTGDTILR